MNTAYRADERSDAVESQPPPFGYPREASYARQLLLSAVVTVVSAVTTVVIASPLPRVSVPDGRDVPARTCQLAHCPVLQAAESPDHVNRDQTGSQWFDCNVLGLNVNHGQITIRASPPATPSDQPRLEHESVESSRPAARS